MAVINHTAYVHHYLMVSVDGDIYHWIAPDIVRVNNFSIIICYDFNMKGNNECYYL